VHQLVLDGDLEDPPVVGPRIAAGSLGHIVHRREQLVSNPIAIVDDLVGRGPLGGGLVAIDPHGIDPAFEECIELGQE